jgi:sulfur-carrier protein
MTVTLRYFAWIRERIGRSEEMLDVPADVTTVGELVGWLKAKGPEYAAAFERAEVIRAAVDHAHVQRNAGIAGAREIAFFPPVTGG